MVGQKNSTQPNPLHKPYSIHLSRVGLGWTHGFDKFIIIIIIIKLSRKKYKYIKKNQKISINVTS